MLKIIEHFYSLQGEGSRIGIPSYFIRLGYCPFRCKFCDSKFALSDNKSICTLENELEFRNFYSNFMYNKPFSSVVITGGEPLYKNNLNMLKDFVKFLKISNNYHITFETTMITDPKNIDGSTNITKILNELTLLFGNTDILYSVSPKLNMCAYRRFKNIILDNVFNYYRIDSGYESILSNLNYKFVYSHDIVKDLIFFIDYCIPESFRHNIFVMPITPVPFNREVYQHTCIEVANFCKEKGLRYSSRIHIDLWEFQKGV